MIIARCIRKIRDNNNIIIQYELEATDGERIIVTSHQLRVAMINKQIDITNLQLTKDNKIIDKSIESSIDGLSKISSEAKADEDAEKLFNKTKLIGTAPQLDSNGGVVDVTGDTVVFSDVTNAIAEDIIAKTIMFKGRLPLKLAEDKPWKKCTMNIVADKVIIENQAVLANINKEIPVGNYDVRIFTNSLVINFDAMPIKIIDMIFKIIKENINNLYHDSKRFTYDVTFNINKIVDGNAQEIFKRSIMILKRQKPSAVHGRRLFDLTVYVSFLMCMYNSLNNNGALTQEMYDTYIELYKEYDAEMDLIKNTTKVYTLADCKNHFGSAQEKSYMYTAFNLMELTKKQLNEIFG